jgi:Uma2 family endonuclease
MSTTTETPAAPDIPPLPLAPVSFEEFLAWAPETARVEWVDGEIIVMAPVGLPHVELNVFLTALLHEYIEANNLGALLTAPFLMRLASRPSGREPDLLFVAGDHLDRIQPTYLDGPADIAVEIVSPDSVSRDRGDKFAEYEAAGVREYWLIDPERQEALFYALGPAGRYQRVSTDAGGIFRSTVLPGFWLCVDWLWQRPLPKLAEVRRQLGIA